MNEKERLKETILLHIKEHPEQYPFISHFWKIEVIEKLENKRNDVQNQPVSYGHYKTIANNSKPFYKPISKIIDFSKLDE